MPRVHLASGRKCRLQLLRRNRTVQPGSGEKVADDSPLDPAIEFDLMDRDAYARRKVRVDAVVDRVKVYRVAPFDEGAVEIKEK